MLDRILATTLECFLLDREALHPDATGELSNLHQRTPLVIGSVADVGWARTTISEVEGRT
ncbi:MAG: hypothetical protein ACRELE_08250 [Gemmatimonadales bacterium]